jgi:hypothetical protein
MKEFNFHYALRDCLVRGVRIRRSAWDGTPCFVCLAKDTACEISKDEIVNMGRALVCRTSNGSFVPWIPTQSDMLSGDWQWLEATTGSWATSEPETPESACCEKCG